MPPEDDHLVIQDYIGWDSQRIQRLLRDISFNFTYVSNHTNQLSEVMGQFVGLTTEREGEIMPEVGIASEATETVVIPVPPTSAARRDTFASLNLSDSLVNDMSSAAWLAALARLEESCQNASFTVSVGAYGADDVLPMFGTRVAEWVSRDVAERYIDAATSGSLRLIDTEESRRNTYNALSIHPTGGQLEVEALRTYFGTVPAVDTIEEQGTGDMLVYVTSLRSMVLVYGEFRRDYRRDYIRQALRMRRNDTTVSPVSKRDPWDSSRIENFEKFLTGLTSKLKPTVDPFLKLPILPHKTLSSRKWGIEIEAVHINGVDTPAGWQLKSDGSLRDLSATSLPSRSIPHVEGCASYRMDVTAECDCTHSHSSPTALYTEVGEWNSPILKSFHSRGLKYLTGELESRRTNNSAGIHVHVEAADLKPEQAVMLSIIYTALEPLFRNEYHRNGTRQYCEPVNTGELVNRFRQARQAKEQGKTIRDMSFGRRYWTVNLASLHGKGTVEFRAMGPKYNYEHLVRWAYFCREMVNLAKADVPQKVWASIRTIEDLIVVFSKYGKETPTPDWAADYEAEVATERVVNTLGTENRRTPNVTRLVPDDVNSLEVYFDDYSAAQPVLSGRRSRNNF